MSNCPICGCRVDPVPAKAHARWHEVQEARYELMHAHVENLIERVYELEGGDAGVPCEHGIRPDDPAGPCGRCR